MLRNVPHSAFSTIFPRMSEEFPPSEMKSEAEFLQLLRDTNYTCFGYYDEDKLVGYALGYLHPLGIFWLDYLHVFKENQDSGYGGKLLAELLQEKAKVGILLEVEKSECDDYDDPRNRRLRFYDRFNIQQTGCPYLFPCTDGTYIDTLSLCFIPADGVTFVSKEDLQKAVSESVRTIHHALPHHEEVLSRYLDKIGDLEVKRFTLEDPNLEDEEEIAKIGELIYHTDPWVYPAFFDNQIELSRKCAKPLLQKDTLFHHKNIKVGKINGQIAGFMVILHAFPKNNYAEMKAAMEDSLGHLTPRFEETMEGYFNTLDYEWEGTQIMSLAVLPECRGLHVATKMLNALPKKVTYSLACVKDNKPARDLYRKCGFTYKFDYPGFTGVMCVELVRKGR